MTKQEILSAVKTRNERIEVLYDQVFILAKERDAAVADFLTPYLHQYKVLGNGFDLSVSGDYFHIVRATDSDKFAREMITISARENYSRDSDQSSISKLETSFYSTSENSLFELERMIVIGRVGEMLLNHLGDLIVKLSEMFTQCTEASRELSRERYLLEREVVELKKLLNGFEIAEAFEKLKKGVNFETERYIAYPKLTLKFNDVVSLSTLKLIDVSGKSATVEFTVHSYGGPRVRLDKVKLAYLETFTQHYSERILESEREVIA